MSLRKLIAIGSSIMQDWTTVAQVFPHLTVTNLAIGGTITDFWIPRLPRILAEHQPDALWCYVGSNDLNHPDTTVEQIAANQAKLTVIAQSAGVPIAWLQTIKAPQKRQRWDDIDHLAAHLAEQLSAADRLITSDPVCLPNGEIPRQFYQADDLHLNDHAYTQLAAHCRSQLADWPLISSD